jgi:putative ABC transport system ATP-binding protein
MDASAAGPAIRLREVAFRWKRDHRFALAVAAFDLARGERVLLTGPSGAGKSTLLGLVSGTLTAEAGEVSVLGHDLTAMSGPARDRFRAAHLGVIFQMFNLIPYLSISDNVLLPLGFSAERRLRAERRPGGARGEAKRLLEALGLDLDLLARNDAADLSVGQQQRVAAARALIGAPEIVIADEPTSALDRDRQEAFLALLFAEVERAGSSLLMVSHEERFAGRFDRRVALSALGAGRVAA